MTGPMVPLGSAIHSEQEAKTAPHQRKNTQVLRLAVCFFCIYLLPTPIKVVSVHWDVPSPLRPSLDVTNEIYSSITTTTDLVVLLVL